MSSSITPHSRIIDLPKLHEFSFELDKNEAISILLIKGTAEVFGYELIPNVEYGFAAELRATIHSFTGCSFELRSATASSLENSYTSDESSLANYLGLHVALMNKRLQARPSSNASLDSVDDEVLAPKVLVIGSNGSGKSSLIKTMLNWRTREVWSKQGGKGANVDNGGGAIFVNLDTAQGALTVPGTLSLTTITALLPTTTPVNPFGTTMSSGPPIPFPSTSSAEWRPPPNLESFAPPLNSLIYWFGHQSAADNQPLYEHLLKVVGKTLEKKLNLGFTNLNSWKAGVFIDTPGEWSEKKNLGMINKAVRALGANIVLVVGNQRLEDQVKKLLDTNKTVIVVRVPAANGASEWDDSLSSRIKDLQIRNYFYGGPELTSGVLSPFSIIVKFEVLRIVRVGEALSQQAPDSALPIGFGRTVGDLDLVPIDLEDSKTPSELLFKLLAIPQAPEGSSDEIVVNAPVLGWCYVSAIDQAKKKVTLLSPLPGKLPRKTLILGSVDWQDA